MSKYDSIETAAELVVEVQLNGLSTDQEDICRVQDIFGRAPVKELIRLANDIGRNNAQGELDPKGAWSSGRKGTQGTFYMIVSHIWNWEEVTRFWNRHTNPQTEELSKEREARKQTDEANATLRRENDELKDRLSELLDRESELVAARDGVQSRAEEAEAEVVRLKAKLYDLLVERKEVV